MRCKVTKPVIGHLSLVICFMFPCALYAAPPSQKDVFKSIQDSVGPTKQIDTTPVILLALAGGAVLVVLVALSRRERKVATPQTLNHPVKLTKEVVKHIQLRPSEIKQLKMLADHIETETGEPPNPLTLLLCPSLLARAVQANPPKLDRKALALLVRKMKLSRTSPGQSDGE